MPPASVGAPQGSDSKVGRDLGPGVPFPPPLLFVGGFGIGMLLDRLWPLWTFPQSVLIEGAGLLLAVMGVAMVITGMLTFRRARTAVYPNRPASVIVDYGIYAYTRNPMYVGLTTLYAGMALITPSLWAWPLLPLVLTLLVTQVIQREERHLTERFPVEYAAYCARVGRWW